MSHMRALRRYGWRQEVIVIAARIRSWRMFATPVPLPAAPTVQFPASTALRLTRTKSKPQWRIPAAAGVLLRLWRRARQHHDARSNMDHAVKRTAQVFFEIFKYIVRYCEREFI